MKYTQVIRFRSVASAAQLNVLQREGGSYFPYILLNENETMFSQLAKQSHWKLSLSGDQITGY